MSNTDFTQDFWTSFRRLPDGDTRIGNRNRLWYDSRTNTIRIWNGQPGGRLVGGGGTAAFPILDDGQVLTTSPTSLNFAGTGVNASVIGDDVTIEITGGGGASVTIDDSPPAPSNNGDLWWDSESGQLKIFYEDVDSSQWVDASSGALGPIGYTGSDGSLGYTGSQGSGFTGSSGFAGSSGFVGSQGIQGLQGIGNIGFTGSQGVQGIQGIGFTGSQGIQGNMGFSGSQGDVGFVGSQGDIGFSGSSGFVGSQGVQGITGSQGVQGIQGNIGYTGSIGFTGSQGVQGTVGFTGSQGIQGSTGAGFTGSQGTVGFVGSAGADGDGTAYYGQVASQTPQTFTGLAQGVYVPMTLLDFVFDTDNVSGTEADGFGVKNISGTAQLMYCVITVDSSTANNRTTGLRLAIDGVGIDLTVCQATTGTQNFAKLMTHYMLEVPDGSTVSAQIANVTNNGNVTVERAKLVVQTVGRQGETGFVGSQGTQGVVGFTGSQGIQGVQGVVGFTGSQGTQGTLGFAGSQGTQGTTGVSPGGTTNQIAKFTGTNTLGNSQIFDNGTNVGIGTTSPSAPLEVRKDGAGTQTVARFSNFGTDEHYLVLGINDETNLVEYSSTGASSGAHAWKTGNTERMRIDSSGNVGVGTTSPSQKLHVSTGSTGGILRLSGLSPDLLVMGSDGGGHYQEWNSDTPSKSKIRLQTRNSGSGSYSVIGINADDHSIRFDTDGAEKMRITSSGSVGVGTTSPNYKVDVSCSLANDGLRVSGTQRRYVEFQSTDEHCNVFINSADGSYFPSLLFQRNSTTRGIVQLQRSSNSDSLGNYAESEMLLGSSGTTPISLITNSERRLYIDSSGRVGIGTTSPISKLQVNVSGTPFTPSQSASLGGADSTRVQITGAEPQLMLTSDLSASTAAQTGTSTFSMGMGQGFYAFNDVRSQIFWSGNSPLVFTYASTPTGSLQERMRIASNGRVGIGTTAPAQLLHVEGATKIGRNYHIFSSNTQNVNNGQTILIDLVLPGCGVYYIEVIALGSNTAGANYYMHRNHVVGLACANFILSQSATTIFNSGISPSTFSQVSGATYRIAIDNVSGTNYNYENGVTIRITTVNGRNPSLGSITVA